MPLIDERDNTFSCTHGGAKFLAVALVYGSGARNEIGRRPYYEEPSGRYRGEESETCPFHKFAEIVGRGDIAVKSFGGQIVVGVAWFAQMADYVVGVPVDGKSGKEHRNSHGYVPPQQVGRTFSILWLGKPIESPTLHHAIDDVEGNAHQHDGYGHAALASHEQGKDEAPLEIMEQEQREQEHLWQSRGHTCIDP